MTNKTCEYRNICGHLEDCAEYTQREEEWCPYAKDLAKKSVELELEHWNSLPIGNDDSQVGRGEK